MILYFVMGASKKIQRKATKKGKQALHQYFKPAPEALERYIRIVNSLPSVTDKSMLFLTIPGGMFSEVLNDPKASEVKDEIIEAQYFQWIKFVKSLPPEIGQFYLPPDFESHKPEDNKARFEFLEWSHYRVEYFNQLKNALKGLSKFKDDDIAFNINFPRDTSIFIDAEGVINIRTPAFLQAIDGVEITRIRECPVCSSIFWAGRTTQQCCTPRCSNIFRVRRHRFRSDEEKGELKLKRIKQEENKPRGKDK
jgi:hypothetical protein